MPFLKISVGKLIIAIDEGKQKDKPQIMNIQKVYLISFWNTKIFFSENYSLILYLFTTDISCVFYLSTLSQKRRKEKQPNKINNTDKPKRLIFMSSISNRHNIYTVVMEEKGLILNHDKHELKPFTKMNIGKSC